MQNTLKLLGIYRDRKAPTMVLRSLVHWRAVCSESCTHGSVGGGWKSAAHHVRQLAGRLPYIVDGNRDLDDPTDHTHAGLFRGFILRNSDVGAAALTLDVFCAGKSVEVT
jgi:hypothetical protein